MRDEEKQEHYQVAERLLAEQNFTAAAIVGAVAALVAAAAYAIAVAGWNFAYGFAAAGIGVVVGASMHLLGRGISTKFGVLAAVYTLVGCLLGNFFSVLLRSSRSPIEVLRTTPLPELAERVSSELSLGDLLYWFIAVFAAVYLAKRPLSRSERLAIGLYRLKS